MFITDVYLFMIKYESVFNEATVSGLIFIIMKIKPPTYNFLEDNFLIFT